jgi:branched-chain amino acid transport system substrate-binding protein
VWEYSKQEIYYIKEGQEMKKESTFWSVAILLILSLVFVGENFAQTKKMEEIEIAVLTGLTGRTAPWGQQVQRMAILIEKEVNEAGGIKELGGAKLKIKIYDTESKPAVAATEALKAIKTTKAAILMGCVQSAAGATASEQAERFEVPFVDFGDNLPKLTQRGFKYFFRTCPTSDDFVDDSMKYLEWITKKTGASPTNKKVAIMVVDEPTGLADGNRYEQMIPKALGWEITERINYPREVKDFTPWLSKLKARGIDFILRKTYTQDAMLLTQQLVELDYNLLGIHGVTGGDYNREYYDVLKERAEFTSVVNYNSPFLKIKGLKELNDKFKKQYGADIECHELNFATGISIALDAIKRANSLDPQKIVQALGVTDISSDRVYYEQGKWWFCVPDGCKFDSTGQNTRVRSVTTQWRNGKLLPIHPPEYAAVDAVWPKPTWKAMGVK